MHVAARRVVERAVASGAKVDPVAHFDAIAALDAAARGMQAGSGARIDLLDAPARAGNAVLRRLSWNALEWYETRARRWFERPMLDLALAWAMAHSRSPAAFRQASEPRRALRAVERWARGLTCSFEALLAATDSLLPDPHGEPGNKTEGGEPAAEVLPDYLSACGPMLLRLMQETRLSPDELLWKLPVDHLLAVRDAIRSQDDAERRAAEPGAARDPQSPEVLAFVRFRKASDAFLKLVTEGPDNGE